MIFCPSALIIIHSHWDFPLLLYIYYNFFQQGLEGDVLIPLYPPFSLQPPVPNFCHMHLYPEMNVFFPSTASRAKILANPACRKAVKSLIRQKHFAFSRIPLYICQIPDSNNRTIGEGGSWSRIPPPFSRQSRIPTISHLYPEYRFLSQ